MGGWFRECKLDFDVCPYGCSDFCGTVSGWVCHVDEQGNMKLTPTLQIIDEWNISSLTSYPRNSAWLKPYVTQLYPHKGQTQIVNQQPLLAEIIQSQHIRCQGSGFHGWLALHPFILIADIAPFWCINDQAEGCVMCTLRQTDMPQYCGRANIVIHGTREGQLLNIYSHNEFHGNVFHPIMIIPSFYSYQTWILLLCSGPFSILMCACRVAAELIQ